MSLVGGVKVLTKRQMYDIHLTILRVLREVGLEIHMSDKGFVRLRNLGLRVDEASRHVWLDDELVLETIRQLCGARSTEVTLEGVDKDPIPCVLPAKLEIDIGAVHGFLLDDRRQMRPVQHKDLFDSLRLKKSLPGVPATHAGLMTQEVPGEVAYIHTTAFNVKYCKTPVATDCNGPEDAVWITRIMRAAGAWDDTQEAGWSSIFARSPLCLTGRGVAFLEISSRAGRPQRVTGMPTPAATAPGTLASYLVQFLAESFGFTTIGRLLCDPLRELPVIGNDSSDITVMDVRRGIFFIAGPDVSLMRMAMKQLSGEFYKSTGCHCCGIRTYTDAKEPGIQAALEKTFQAMCDLMAGMYSTDPAPVAPLYCVGSLNINLVLSFEQAVIDYEFWQMLNHFLAGIRMDQDTLGFDAIKRVGPSGEFLSDEHTLKHARSEWWFPSLFHRGAWDTWQAEGKPDVMKRAGDIVRQSKKIEVPCVLPDDTAREIDRLVQKAERDLLGSTTGLLP